MEGEKSQQKCVDADASNTIYNCKYSGAIKTSLKYEGPYKNVPSQTTRLKTYRAHGYNSLYATVSGHVRVREVEAVRALLPGAGAWVRSASWILRIHMLAMDGLSERKQCDLVDWRA